MDSSVPTRQSHIPRATTAVASIFAPPLVTGTDPTRIPLVAMLVPLAAMAVTGFICLHTATSRPSRS